MEIYKYQKSIDIIKNHTAVENVDPLIWFKIEIKNVINKTLKYKCKLK